MSPSPGPFRREWCPAISGRLRKLGKFRYPGYQKYPLSSTHLSIYRLLSKLLTLIKSLLPELPPKHSAPTYPACTVLDARVRYAISAFAATSEHPGPTISYLVSRISYKYPVPSVQNDARFHPSQTTCRRPSLLTRRIRSIKSYKTHKSYQGTYRHVSRSPLFRPVLRPLFLFQQ